MRGYSIARVFLGQSINESQAEENKMTLDEFDTKLKTLLMDAGKSGIDVRSIFVDNINTSTNSEECYILQDYRVEYSRGGR